MSTCISREGEYSDHELAENFTCSRCFAFDEDAALARITELEAERGAPTVQAMTREERHAMIEAAVAEIEPCVTNNTAAWNTWNNLASSKPFVRAILTLNGAINWKGRAHKAEAERDGYAAVIEKLRNLPLGHFGTGNYGYDGETVDAILATVDTSAVVQAIRDDGWGAIADEVRAEIRRSIEKHGEQDSVPLGTGDQVPFLHGCELPQPHPHVAVTMGTLAYTARNVTDSTFRDGYGTWADILLEETAELLAEDHPARVREEAVQVAAVAMKIVAQIDAAAIRSQQGGGSDG